MNATTFYNLRQYDYAKKHKPSQAVKVTSRRSTKSNGNGTGQKFLKHGRIVSELSRGQLGY